MTPQQALEYGSREFLLFSGPFDRLPGSFRAPALMRQVPDSAAGQGVRPCRHSREECARRPIRLEGHGDTRLSSEYFLHPKDQNCASAYAPALSAAPDGVPAS